MNFPSWKVIRNSTVARPRYFPMLDGDMPTYVIMYLLARRLIRRRGSALPADARGREGDTMRARHLLGALFTVSLLAAPAWAVDCATSGTVTVTGPAGVTSQLWLQTGNAFNVLPVQNSSIWVRTQDGTAFSVLLVINSTESAVLPAIAIRDLAGTPLIGGTVEIPAGATFTLPIDGCSE